MKLTYMKLLVTIISLSFCTIVFGQSDDVLEYNAKTIHMVFTDSETTEIANNKPLGKDVVVTYDTFFKRWTLEYTGEAGTRVQTYFSFISDGETEGTLVKDGFEKLYYCFNQINNKGKLLFLFQDPVEGFIVHLEIVGFSNR